MRHCLRRLFQSCIEIHFIWGTIYYYIFSFKIAFFLLSLEVKGGLKIFLSSFIQNNYRLFWDRKQIVKYMWKELQSTEGANIKKTIKERIYCINRTVNNNPEHTKNRVHFFIPSRTFGVTKNQEILRLALCMS